MMTLHSYLVLLFYLSFTCLSFLADNSRCSEDLKCYTCSGIGSNTPCQNLTSSNVGMIYTCPRTSCTVVNVRSRATGKITSYYRGCDNRDYKPECVEDDKFVTCFYSCRTNLCNNGTGITPEILKLKNNYKNVNFKRISPNKSDLISFRAFNLCFILIISWIFN